MIDFGMNGKAVKDSAFPADRDEVVTGMLRCACGSFYPVIEGVPRLLEAGISAFPNFIEANKERIKGVMGNGEPPHLPQNKENGDDFGYIRESFSKEWGLFDYASDKTWGWSLDDRKRVFLDDLSLEEHDVRGKLLLDAGCGNGTLTAALSTFGMEVVGIDLNDGLGLANRNKPRYAGEFWKKVHFVQGNIYNPPLRAGSFDLIYCSGVIHHTPSSKGTFKRLVPLLKKGGRVHVWVYGKRRLPVRAFFAVGRQLKNFMPPKFLLTTCRAMAPLYKLGISTLDALRISKFRNRSVREISLDLFDAFAPQYNHWHAEEEVQSWFREQGFMNVTVSGRQKHGFGVYGDKP